MFIRRLRSLPAQLLLWIMLPTAVVLVILSLAGIFRHRQAMTAMIEDRDRSLTLAEANRLGREVEQRVAQLTQVARSADPAGTQTDSARALTLIADRLSPGYGRGLALFDAQGRLAGATAEADWATGPVANSLVAGVLAMNQPKTGDLFRSGDSLLLVAAPTSAGGVLVAALPVETLSLVESTFFTETVPHGMVLVLNRDGQVMHHANPLSITITSAALARVPPPPANGSGVAYLDDTAGESMLVTYARVDPPGWTLYTAEGLSEINAMSMSAVEVLPMVLLFIAVVAILAVSFGVAQIVRPLQELDRRAARVAWGDFDAVKQPVGGVQEMDDLRATLAQMADRIRSYQAGMRDYLSAVTHAQEDERFRLAHELHDETVQALIALKQRAQMARKSMTSDPERAAGRLDELESLIDRELTGLRRLIGDLRPIYLEDLGFVPALEMLVQQIGEHPGLTVDLSVEGETIRLAPDVEMAAFRIVQQALNNVATHAQAGLVTVTIAFAADGLTLTVRDDGRGFVPPEQPSDLTRAGHYGLMGMRERALLYGGHLTIQSAPGKGTTVAAYLPLAGVPV